jgi:hypothetical protein
MPAASGSRSPERSRRRCGRRSFIATSSGEHLPASRRIGEACRLRARPQRGARENPPHRHPRDRLYSRLRLSRAGRRPRLPTTGAICTPSDACFTRWSPSVLPTRASRRSPPWSSTPPRRRRRSARSIPRVSIEYEAVVRRCLEKDPVDRFQTYPELIDALLPPTEPLIRAARPIPAIEAPREWVWPAAAAAGLTLLTIILLAIFTTDPGPPPVEARAPAVHEPLLRPPPAPPPAPPPVEGRSRRPLQPFLSRSSRFARTVSLGIRYGPPPTRWRPSAHRFRRKRIRSSWTRSRGEPGPLISTTRRRVKRGSIRPPGTGCSPPVATATGSGSNGVRGREGRVQVGIGSGRRAAVRAGPLVPALARVPPAASPLSRRVPTNDASGGPGVARARRDVGNRHVVPRRRPVLVFLEDRLLFSVPAADCGRRGRAAARRQRRHRPSTAFA